MIIKPHPGQPTQWSPTKAHPKNDLPKSLYRALYALIMSVGKLKLPKISKKKGEAVNQSTVDIIKNHSNIKRHTSCSEDVEYKRMVSEMEDWELSHSLMVEAMDYYDTIYGNIAGQPPDDIRLSKAYLTQDPVEVARSFKTFDMTVKDMPFCWVARFGLCLPLPPEYSQISDSEGTIYIHKLRLVRLRMHPGLLFIRDLARKSRILAQGISYETTPERFQDFIDIYNKRKRVDMVLVILALEGDEDAYKHYVNKLAVKESKDPMETNFRDKAGEEDREEIFGKSKIIDFMIFDVCKQAGVDCVKQPHLVGFVTAFMLEKEVTEKEWEFRKPEHHNFFWVNTIIKKAQSEYPFLEELKAQLLIHKESLEKQFKHPNNFRETQGLAFIFKNQNQVEIKTEIDKQRIEFMNRVVIKRTKNLKEIKMLRKKDHLNQKITSNNTGSKKGRNNSKSRESSVSSQQSSRMGSPGKKPSNFHGPNIGLHFASEFLMRKEERQKAKQENEKDNNTRQMMKEIHDLLGEDIIVIYQLIRTNMV